MLSVCIIFVPSMARIMAIDYGRKRVGVAVTDPMQIIAGGLATVPAHEIVAFIEKYVATEAVETIVVGLPKQMNNQPSESMRYIQPFVATLKKKLPNIPVVFYDASVGKYMQAEGYGVELSDFVIRELRSILGDGAVILR